MPQGSNDAASARLFSNGRIAQEMIVSAAVNIIKTTGPKVYPDLRSVPAPWKSGKQISRLHPLSIVKKTKNMDGAVAFVTFMTQPENMAQLMRGSLDVFRPSPRCSKVKGMKAWLDGLKWSTGYRAIKPVSQLDVEGDFVYHDTEFGQIITTNFQRALSGSSSRLARWRTPRARLRRWRTASSSRTRRPRQRGTISQTSLPRPRTLSRPRARRGWRRVPFGYVLILPVVVYEAVFLLYPMYRGLELGLQTPGGGHGLKNYRRLINDDRVLGHRQDDAASTRRRRGVLAAGGPRHGAPDERDVPGPRPRRAVLTTSWAFPDVPTTIAFLWMLNPTFGVANVFARWLPWVHDNPQWLNSEKLACSA